MRKAQRRSRLVILGATVALLAGMAVVLGVTLSLANSTDVEAIVQAAAF